MARPKRYTIEWMQANRERERQACFGFWTTILVSFASCVVSTIFYLLLARKETSELFLRAGFDSKYYYITCNLYCRCWFRMCAEFLCRKTPTRSRATWIDAVLSVVGLGLLLGVRMERSNTEDNFFQIKQSSCLWTRSYCWTRPDNERI